MNIKLPFKFGTRLIFLGYDRALKYYTMITTTDWYYRIDEKDSFFVFPKGEPTFTLVAYYTMKEEKNAWLHLRSLNCKLASHNDLVNSQAIADKEEE